MPLAVRSSRESRSERCKEAFLLAPICKDLSASRLAPTLVSDRASHSSEYRLQSLQSQRRRLVDGAARAPGPGAGHPARAGAGLGPSWTLDLQRGSEPRCRCY